MKNIFETVIIKFLKGVLIFLMAVVVFDVFIVVNELIGNHQFVDNIYKNLKNIFNN